MKKPISITVDEELLVIAKSLHLNLSDVLNTMLKSYLQGVPRHILKQYAQLDKKQKKYVEKKLLRITKGFFEPEVISNSNVVKKRDK